MKNDIAQASETSSKSGVLFPFLTLCLFCISPIASIFPILYGIYKQKKFYFFLLAMFLGAFSVYYVPYGDQYRYYWLHDYHMNATFTDAFNLNNEFAVRNCNLVYLLDFFLAKIDLHFEFTRFLLVFLGFQLVFSVYHDIQKKNSFCNSIAFIFFLSFLFIFPFYTICVGFRTGFASCLFFAGIYFLINTDYKKRGWIYIILAALTHFFFFFLAVLFSIYHVCTRGKLYLSWKVLLVFLLLLPLCNEIIILILSPFADFEIVYVILEAYLSDSAFWNKEFLKQFNYKGQIALFGPIAPMFYLLFLFLRNRENRPYDNLITVFILLMLIFLLFPTVLLRFATFFMLLLLSYAMLHYKPKVPDKSLYLICLLSVFSFSLYFYQQRKPATLGEEKHFFTSTFFYTLSYHYPLQLLEMHIDEDGTLPWDNDKY